MPETLPTEKREGIGEDVRFVSDSMDAVSEALSRYAIVPTPTSIINTEKLASEMDEEIAKALSQVDVVDSHFDNLDFEADQGVAEGAILTAAKAKGLANQIEDPDVKTRLEEFKDRVLAKTGKFLATRGGKAAVTGATTGILAIVMTACGGGEALADPMPDTPGQTQPRTQEVVEIPDTPSPTPTQAPTKTPTQETSPTPEVEQREVGFAGSENVTRDLIPESALEPLPEEDVVRFTFSDGTLVPFGILDEYEEDHRETGGSLIQYLSGIYRGWIPSPAGGNKGSVLLEIPLENGDSQYMFFFIDDISQATFTDIWGIENGVIENETLGNRYAYTFDILNRKLRNQDLVGSQIIFGLQTDFFISPEDSSKERLENFQEELGGLVDNIEQGETVDVSLSWSTFPIRIIAPDEFIR